MVTAAMTVAIGAGAALGLAEEPQGGVAPVKAVPAKPVLARDYSIGTLAPEDTTTQQAVPDAAPPPANGVAPVPAKAPDPQKRPRYGGAILQAVDKVTAETLRFEAHVGQPVRFKGLVVTVNTCETTAPDEDAPDSIAHLSVLSQPDGVTTAAARDAYRGWMYANAAAVHPFQHPVYDLWLIACKASAPVAPAVNP
jgi:hypothetical protein